MNKAAKTSVRRFLGGHKFSSNLDKYQGWQLVHCMVRPGLPHRRQTIPYLSHQFSSVQSLSHVRLFVTPWISACQASQSITNSWSSLKLRSIKSVMPSSHLILCHSLFLLPPIPPSIRVFSNESILHMRWPKYWSFSFSIIPSKEHPGLIFRMGWLDLLAVWDHWKSKRVPGKRLFLLYWPGQSLWLCRSP